MTDRNEGTSITDRQDAGPTPEGIEQEPRGNPEPDQEAVEKGVDTLERVKPY